jgi:hypothetical protein
MRTQLRKPAPDQAKVRPFTIYLPEELDLWLRQESVEQGRTLTAQTVRVIQAGRQAMAERDCQVAR